MADNFKETIIDIMEHINRFGLEAVQARETETFEEKVNSLYKYIVQKYYYFLLAVNNISEERISATLEKEEVCRMDITLERYAKRVESLITAYQAVCKEVRIIEKIVNDYESQEKEYDFFWFAENKYFKKIKARAIRDEYFKFKQGGMRVGKREGYLVSKCLKFLEDNHLQDFDESTMIEFASKVGYKIEKVKEVWEMHENLKYKSLNNTFYDEDGNAQELDFIDESAEEKYEEVDSEYGELDKFALFIKLLNAVYYKDFTTNMQRCYPHIFTTDFICQILKDIMAKTKARSLEEVKRSYWDRVDLPGYRDEYATAENVCVLREHFDWSIENRDYRTRKAVAKLLGVSEESIRKTNVKVVELLKRKVAEKHYAE